MTEWLSHKYIYIIYIIYIYACVLNHFRHVQLFVTLWTTPLSMGFSREECWNGFPCPPPGDLPNPRIQSASLGSPALGGEFFTTSTPGEAHKYRLPWCLNSKESACYAGAAGDMGFDPCVRQIPWKRAWQPIPVFLPGWRISRTEEPGGLQSME